MDGNTQYFANFPNSLGRPYQVVESEFCTKTLKSTDVYYYLEQFFYSTKKPLVRASLEPAISGHETNMLPLYHQSLALKVCF